MLPLFGFAPGGVCPAMPVASHAVRSYRTISPLPDKSGGMFSVALSLGLPPPGVTRHHISVEPGLSSSPFNKSQRPSSALNRGHGVRAEGPSVKHCVAPSAPAHKSNRDTRRPECRQPGPDGNVAETPA